MTSKKTGVPVEGTSGGFVGDLANNPAIQGALVSLIGNLLSDLPGLIAGLFKRQKPTKPVVQPLPNPVPQEPDFPDDIIPTPQPNGRKVTKVRLKLARAQYNRQRFPEQYNDANPMGLYSNEDLRAIESGTQALNYGSKFWLDLTPYDQNGKEFLRDAVLAYNLDFKTEIRCGEAYIIGNGSEDRVDAHDSNEIGNGITAFNSSLGFLHQMKAHGEGEFRCSGSVDGVDADQSFTIRVS